MNAALYYHGIGSPTDNNTDADPVAMARRWVTLDWVRVLGAIATFVEPLRTLTLPWPSEVVEGAVDAARVVLDLGQDASPSATMRERATTAWKVVQTILGWIVSPTWMSANLAKLGLRGGERSRLIRLRNRRYFRISLALAAVAEVVSLIDSAFVQRPELIPFRIVLFAYLISRCNEVFYAFYRDAIEKLVPRQMPRSSLSWARRLRLALNSYVELVLDFALMYLLLPIGSLSPKPDTFTDLIFYSASTISTSGGGGIVPVGMKARLLTDYEVFCGLILVVVCFAVYVGRAFADKDRRDRSGKAGTQLVAPPPEGPADDNLGARP